jgi:hypothetical protein
MLSEGDRHRLEDIEHRLFLEDPAFVVSMRGARRPARIRRDRLRALGHAAVALWFAAIVVFLMGHLWEAALASVMVGAAAALVVFVAGKSSTERRGAR